MLLTKKTVTACAVSCFALLPASAFCQNMLSSSDINMAHKWQVNVAYEEVNINQQVADHELIDSSAQSITLDGEYFFDPHVSTAIGIGLLSYDDNNAFTQQTQSVWSNDVSNSSSTAQGVPMYLDVGYTQYSETSVPVYFTARGGFGVMLQSDRSIDNCSDCYSENIDVRDGAYALVGVGVNLFSSFNLGVYYRKYISGDLEDSVGLRLSFGSFRQ